MSPFILFKCVIGVDIKFHNPSLILHHLILVVCCKVLRHSISHLRNEHTIPWPLIEFNFIKFLTGRKLFQGFSIAT
jgi:hypothetical protein